MSEAVVLCLCNGLTDAAIAKALAQGARRPGEVYAACGCKAQCGTCVRDVLAALRAAPAAAAPARLT
ncbi:MAG: (2Fe-2S)-binding protein [Pseudomonadota bacterium]